MKSMPNQFITVTDPTRYLAACLADDRVLHQTSEGLFDCKVLEVMVVTADQYRVTLKPIGAAAVSHRLDERGKHPTPGADRVRDGRDVMAQPDEPQPQRPATTRPNGVHPWFLVRPRVLVANLRPELRLRQPTDAR